MIINGEKFRIDIIKDMDINEGHDVEFYLHFNNKVYFCWAFTISAIQSVMNKDKSTGESANGSFFWATDMIVVEDISEKCLLKTIGYLIEKEPCLIDSMFSIVKK